MKSFTSGFAALLVGVLSYLSLVSANTPLADSFVTHDLSSNNGFEIAFASRPLWHFARSLGHNPCYPTSAFDTATGAQWGVNASKWPNAAAGCPDPGPLGEGNPFPTYYTVTRCADAEVRVAYHLYFQKDGWSNVLLARGHMHDWERIIVIWKRDADGLWRRKELLKSYHSGYKHDDWAMIQNTFDHSNFGEQSGKDKDGAKVYVAWGKHAMFTTRNSNWNDPTSQGCARAFRSGDWWRMPSSRADLVYVGAGSEVGNRISAMNWGSATSTPAVVEGKVCGEREGGYVSC